MPLGREQSEFLALFSMAFFKEQIHIHHWIYRLHPHESVDGPFSTKTWRVNRYKAAYSAGWSMMSQPANVCIISYVYLLKYK